MQEHKVEPPKRKRKRIDLLRDDVEGSLIRKSARFARLDEEEKEKLIDAEVKSRMSEFESGDRSSKRMKTAGANSEMKDDVSRMSYNDLADQYLSPSVKKSNTGSKKPNPFSNVTNPFVKR